MHSRSIAVLGSLVAGSLAVATPGWGLVQATPAAAGAAAPAKAMPKLKLQRVAPEIVLRRPVQVVFEPGNDQRMYVLEQPGRVLILDPADREAKEPKVFLDMRKQVNSRGNEEGLLSLAFDPDFAKNRTFFLYLSLIHI